MKHFKKTGMKPLASLLNGISIPTFADWRWNTLEACIDEVDKVFDPIAEHFLERLFKKAKDLARLRKTVVALRCKQFRSRMLFCKWYCRMLGGLLRWGGGCQHGSACEGIVQR